MPKVSIIVPVYDVEKYLVDTIKSLINQTEKDIEILLIDDGSTDNSVKICDKYALIDNRIKAIHKINGGVSSARNIGIENSRGEYVAFVDADDIVNECYVEYLLAACEENDSDISYCEFVDFFCVEDINTNCLGYQEIEKSTFDNTFALQHLYPLRIVPNIFCKLFRRSLFAEIRFDVELKRAEDFDVTYQAVGLAKRITAIKDARLYYYRHREGSAMGISTAEMVEQDLGVRLKFYKQLSLSNELKNKYEETREKLSAQTLRFFLDFALVGRGRIKDYNAYKKVLKRYGKLLSKNMWRYHRKNIGDKIEVFLVERWLRGWLFYRKVMWKLFKKPLYV